MLGAASLCTLLFQSKVFATSEYGLSCTNEAYGTQHGGTYIQKAESLGGSGGYGIQMYAGTDCIYSGAARTNGVAIVSGDVARSAANAIVGAVSSRIATAMAQNADTAAHMSYSANGQGIGMAANRVFGGLSIWTNYTSSDFENDQNFVTVDKDSNAYDGDSNAASIGIDKKIGNILVGITATSLDYDIDTTANKGKYEADGETYGMYVGLDTGVIKVSAGFGTGDLNIDTTRTDLGTENTTITGSTTADIEYYHLSASAVLNRGNITIMPRLEFRNVDLDTAAFTDVVPNDANTIATDTLTTADEAVAAVDASSETTTIGVSLARALRSGAVTPYVDLAYSNEDTTAAAYRAEISTDGFADQVASDPDSFYTIGAGVNVNIRGRLTGLVAIQETMDRDDYNETTVSATIRLQF